jgi:hypothetical protein
MSDPTIRRPREEEQRKWREQRRLEEEAEQRRSAPLLGNPEEIRAPHAGCFG